MVNTSVALLVLALHMRVQQHMLLRLVNHLAVEVSGFAGACSAHARAAVHAAAAGQPLGS